MADIKSSRKITDVDFLESLNSDESFFVNKNNSIKQINKSNIVFDIVNGGTGSSNGAIGLSNLLASGQTVLSSNQYGNEFPSNAQNGTIFFKKSSGTLDEINSGLIDELANKLSPFNILWENPYPTSYFEGLTVNLNTDIIYDLYMVEFIQPEIDGQFSSSRAISVFSKPNILCEAQYLFLKNDSSNTIAIASRYFTVDSTGSSIEFGKGCLKYNDNIDYTYNILVPSVVYGIKIGLR